MKQTMTNLVMLAFFVAFLLSCQAQPNSSIMERMGYDADDKLLIIHADDLGVAHSVNEASIEAFEDGFISSASIMVPCPWFPHIAQYAKEHPEMCWGIHLTLTAEWEHYKWDGVSSSNEIRSILTERDFMYPLVHDVIEVYDIEEVKKEIDGQVRRALEFGVPLTHLDTHMGTLYGNEELFKAYLELGNKYKLPVLMPYNGLPPEWDVAELLGPYQVGVNPILMLSTTPESWDEAYANILSQVKPGINELLVHLGKDNAELHEVMINHRDFGAVWRAKDVKVLMSDAFRQRLRDDNIHVVSWKMIRDAMTKT